MRERANELGGSLTVETLPEGGTGVRARLPMPEEG
jgi:signal transduction histidine kinase